MSKNVLDLASEDTRLAVVARRTTKGYGPEYAGPCPGCGGNDRFHVQPDRKDGGAWMCRNCRPAEEYGWSDGIEYLRRFRNMTFLSAKSFLAIEVDNTLHAVEQARAIQPEQGKVPAAVLQERYHRYVTAAAARMWTPEGKPGLDYLLSRGLSEDTIRKALLGFARYKIAVVSGVTRTIPVIVIPWYDSKEGAYWRVNLRNITPDRPGDESKYYNLPGSSNSGLYLGDVLLKRKLPTMLVEGEIDALSIVQAAGDIVNVVATGSTGGSRVFKWESRLARMPNVLIAFDREPKGDKASEYWLKILNNSIRYRPLTHDANDMLTQGYNIRSWVAAGLDYLRGDSEDTDQRAGSSESVAAAQVESSEPDTGAYALESYICSSCGIDLTDVDTAAYSEDGAAYCNYDESTHNAYCSRGTQPVARYEQLLKTALAMAQAIDGNVTQVEQGYSLDQLVTRQRAVVERTPVNRRIASLGVPSWLQPESRDYRGPERRAAHFAGFTDVKSNHWNGHSHFQQRLIDAGERLGYMNLHDIYAIPETRDVIGYEAWLDFARNDTLGTAVQDAVKLAERLLRS